MYIKNTITVQSQTEQVVICLHNYFTVSSLDQSENFSTLERENEIKWNTYLWPCIT